MPANSFAVMRPYESGESCLRTLFAVIRPFAEEGEVVFCDYLLLCIIVLY